MKARCPACGRSIGVSHVALDQVDLRVDHPAVGVTPRLYARLSAEALRRRTSRRQLLDQLVASSLDKAGAP